MGQLDRRRFLSVVAMVGFVAVAVWAVGQTETKPPRPATGDVTAFGAAGDGVADDTAAVQRAVDAGAGAVGFGKGTYRLTRTVVIDLDRVGFTSLVGDGTARVVMEGPGPAFKFIGTHEGTAGPSTFKENVWERQR